MCRSFRLLSLAIIFVSSASVAYAIGDGSSSSSDMPAPSGIINLQEERGRSIMVSLGIEHIFERNLEDDRAASSGKIEGNWLLLGAGYRMKNLYEPYIRLGTLQVDIDWTEAGSDITMESEQALAIGAGFKMLAQALPITSLSKLKVHFDGQLRYSQPSVDNINIAGADVSRNVSAKELSIFEGRAAATVGIEISLKKLALEEDEDEQWLQDMLIMPYAGIGYINSVTMAEFVLNGTKYGFKDTGLQNNFGVIAGVDFIAPEYVIFNMEGQVFGDDRSASGGLNVKF